MFRAGKKKGFPFHQLAATAATYSKAQQHESLWLEMQHWCCHRQCMLSVGGGHVLPEMNRSKWRKPRLSPKVISSSVILMMPWPSLLCSCFGSWYYFYGAVLSQCWRWVYCLPGFMQTLAFISAAICTVWYFKPHLLQSFLFCPLDCHPHFFSLYWKKIIRSVWYCY